MHARHDRSWVLVQKSYILTRCPTTLSDGQSEETTRQLFLDFELADSSLGEVN